MYAGFFRMKQSDTENCHSLSHKKGWKDTEGERKLKKKHKIRTNFVFSDDHPRLGHRNPLVSLVFGHAQRMY